MPEDRNLADRSKLPVVLLRNPCVSITESAWTGRHRPGNSSWLVHMPCYHLQAALKAVLCDSLDTHASRDIHAVQLCYVINA